MYWPKTFYGLILILVSTLFGVPIPTHFFQPSALVCNLPRIISIQNGLEQLKLLPLKCDLMHAITGCAIDIMRLKAWSVSTSSVQN